MAFNGITNRIFRRHPALVVLLTVICTLVSQQWAAGQSPLESMSQDVQQKDRFRPTPKKLRQPRSECDRHHRDSYFDSRQNDRCEEDEPFAELQSDMVTLGASAVGAVATSPFWAPVVMTKEPGSDAGRFLSYPYKNDANGNYEYHLPTRSRHHWFTRLRLDYVDTFDDVESFGGQFMLDTSTRFGFDTEVRRLADTQQFAAGDHFWTGDANLLFRFAINDHVQFRAGPGFNWLRNSAGSDYGYNLTYGFDWYIADPWILSFEYDWGEIGHSHLDHLRLQIGWQYKHVETFVGYDYFSLGATDLHGAVAGLRFWF